MRCGKVPGILALVACLLASVSASAFSRIGHVDTWDAQRLAEAGIRVTTYEHKLTGEDPPFPWVQVSFNCAHIPEDRPVVMTLRLYDEDQQPIAMRRERDNTATDEVIMTFAVTPGQVQPHSALDIVVWSPTPDGGQEARGFRLSLSRNIELAKESEVNQEGG